MDGVENPDWSPFGVTVEQVMGKVKVVNVTDLNPVQAQVTGVPVHAGGNRVTEITREEVEDAIRDVSTRVQGHIVGWGQLPGAVTTHIQIAAADLVKLGAAAYVLDAAFPAGQGPNSLREYSERLWDRHKEGLVALTTLVKDHAGKNDDDPLTGATGSTAVVAPPTMFPDLLTRW